MNKHYLLLLLFFFSALYSASGQAPAIAWQKAIGGSSSDEGYCVSKTRDGGYIMAGVTSSTDGDVLARHDSSEFLIVKLSASGATEWTKTYGGAGKDVARSIKQTTDNGYIIAGYSTSDDGDVTGHHGDSSTTTHGDSVYNNDAWVVKLAADGSIMWQKSLGGSGNEEAYAVVQTFEGDYLVAGATVSSNGDVSGYHGFHDGWLVRLSATGAITWQNTYGGSDYESIHDINQTPDSGFIVCGTSRTANGDVMQSHGSWDVWVFKTDRNGGLLWSKSYGGTGSDYGVSISGTFDGGYILSAGSDSRNDQVTGNHNLEDYWVVKLNDTGRIVWQKCYGTSDYDKAGKIIQTTDSGYVIVGAGGPNDGDVTGNHGGGDFWIVKLTQDGNILWQKSIGGLSLEWAFDINQTSDGGYVVAGYTSSADGDVTGKHGTDFNSDFWMVKLNNGSDVPICIGTPKVAVYPNPMQNVINITCAPPFAVTINNANGQNVFTGRDCQIINTESLPNGVYILSVHNRETGLLFTQKLIK